MIKIGYIKKRLYFDYLNSKLNINNYKIINILQRHILNCYIYLNHSHFDINYEERTTTRLNKILEIYDIEYFKDKKILVLGDGLGDIGEFFAELGANALSLEGRKLNINLSKLKFGNNINHNYIQADLNKDFTHLGKFDIIINWGFMEVIENYKNVFDCCNQMANEVWIESVVYDGLGIKTFSRGGKGNDWEMGNEVNIVSPEIIEDYFLIKKFSMNRYFDTDLNTRLFFYDWKKDDKLKNKFKCRFWIFKR